MNLPPFWRQASFAVAEAAELLGVPEMTLRTWLARAPFNDFLGAKTGGRIFLSGHDIFFWALVRDLAGFGVSVRLSMLSAQSFADAARYDLPADERLIVRKSGPEQWSFEIVDEYDLGAISALVIPMRALAINLIERAAVVYANEAN